MKEINTWIHKWQLQASLQKWWLLAVLVGLFIPHWISSYHNVQVSIGPDLLLRTIGSRLQEASQLIYQYKWQPGDPIGWLNPYEDTRIGLNGVVSTPFLLWLLQPLARLDYCDIRTIWGCTQEFFLFGTMWFCCLSFKKRFNQLLFIAVAAAFFIYDRNWLLNLYNGQMYVIYAFAFALSGYLVAHHKNYKSVIFFFPLVSIIRPFFAPAVLPFLKAKKTYITYLIASVAISVLLVSLTTTTGEWKQYNTAMKLYAQEQTGGLAFDTIPGRLYLQYADACTINPDANFAVFGSGCLYSLQHYLYLVGITINSVIVYQAILLVSILLVLLIANKKDWLNNSWKQLLLSFLLYQLCELITPASRNPYNMIQWLPAVAWLFASGNRNVLWVIVAGLCLNHDLPFWFKYQREIGEIFLFAALIIQLFYKKNRTFQV